MKGIFAVITIAAAATALSLTVPGTVSAGSSSQAATVHIGNTYAKGRAGYHMGGWRFRYITTTFTVPASTTRATNASLDLESAWDAIHLTVKAGGGPGSITYGISYWYDGDKTLNVAPRAGDKVSIGIYQDPRAGVRSTSFTAVDLTTGSKATAVEGFYRYDFVSASIAAGGPTWNFASRDTRLWAFTNTQLTSRNGTRGTLLGPWAVDRVIGTRSAAPGGKVVLWPTYPWNNGRNFGVWWQASS